MTESSPTPRRRRRRGSRGDGEPPAEAQSAAGPVEAPAVGPPDAPAAVANKPARSEPARSEPARSEPARGKPRTARRRPDRQADRPARDGERGWRDLVGNAPSQVGVSGALRARDLARPTAEDLAAAERDLTIVRRQWKPPEEPGR